MDTSVQKLLYAIGGLIALLLIVGFALPAQTRFVVSLDVSAHRATVFALVNDMRRRSLWSPIISSDPDARVVFSGPPRGVGASLSWQGPVAGSGTQTITASRAYEHVEILTNPGEPGETRTWFDLGGDSRRTTVRWGFQHDYGLNIIGRYFGLIASGVIRRDYERGVANLKELAESLPAADFGDLEIEERTVSAETIVLRPTSSAADPASTSEALSEAYFEILAFMDRHGLVRSGPPISIARAYTGAKLRFDPGIPVVSVGEDTHGQDGNVRLAETYAGKVLRIRHVGSYQALAVTHRKIAAYLAVLGIERNGDAWESYVTDPADVDEAQLITDIYYPIRDR